MTWDFAEANPFADAAGNLTGRVDWYREGSRSS